MGLEGALKSPEMESFPAQWPPAETDFENPPAGSAGRFLNQLEAEGQPAIQPATGRPDENPHPDPIVSPPLYGKWYAKAEKLEAQGGTGWVNELNRDPRYRAPAGVGTQVIQKEQEKFMQQAWAQLGDLLRANQKIRQLQLALMSTFVTYQKNILPQPADQLLTFTHAVQAACWAARRRSRGRSRRVACPQAALDPAFRKIARNRGAIMRKVVPEAPAPSGDRHAAQRGERDRGARPPEPTGQILLDKVAEPIERARHSGVAAQSASNRNARLDSDRGDSTRIRARVCHGAILVLIPIVVTAGVLLPFVETLRARIETAETFRERVFHACSSSTRFRRVRISS